MSFVVSLRASEFDSVWSCLVAGSEKDLSLSLSLSLFGSLSFFRWLTGGQGIYVC